MRRGLTEAGPVAISARTLLANRRHATTHSGSGEEQTPRTDCGSRLALDRSSPLAAVMGATPTPAAFKATRPSGFMHHTQLVQSHYEMLPQQQYEAAGKLFVQGFQEPHNGHNGHNGEAETAGSTHRGRNHATVSSATRDGSPNRWKQLRQARTVQFELEHEALLEDLTSDVIALKDKDLERRPTWRPPVPPTKEECDALVSSVRALAFPEFHTKACDADGASTSSAFKPWYNRKSNGSVELTGDRRELRHRLRDLIRITASMLQSSLLIDALDDGTDALGDHSDLPDHVHQSRLGKSVRLMSRDDAIAFAEEHAHKCIIPKFLQELRTAIRYLNEDADSALKEDVATTSRAEIVLSYPGLTALLYHRVSHALLVAGAPLLLSRLISERSHGKTGVDIHPGVKIGPGCFIDHGTGLVIGGTAEIGAHVCLFHGVTLGSRAFPTDAQGRRIKHQKRHPIIEDGVSIYAGATLLGRITVGKGATIASGAVVVKDVPEGHTVAAPRANNTILPPK
jgi:serine O-acetyltransferase